MRGTRWMSMALVCSFACGAAEHEVRLVDHRFEPAQLTITAGDSVRWTNASGMPHNVRADDDRFRCAESCGSPEGGGYGGSAAGDPSAATWSYVYQFLEVETFDYHCEAHGAPGGLGMVGRVLVEAAEAPAFAINFGLTGPWYNPSTSGQGLYVDVVPSFTPPLVAVAWFTFDSESGGEERQRWFTGLGAYQDGSDQVELNLFRTTGGRFNQTEPPAATESVGSALLEFESCTSAVFSYQMELGDNEQGDARSGSIALQRTTPDVICETLANPPDGDQ